MGTHLLAVFREGSRTVIAGACEVAVIEFLTVRRFTAQTLQALATRVESQHHLVIWFHRGDCRTHGDNYSAAFVAENCGKERWVNLIANNCVGVAHSGSNNSNLNFIWSWLIQINGGDLKRLLGGTNNSSKGLHFYSLYIGAVWIRDKWFGFLGRKQDLRGRVLCQGHCFSHLQMVRQDRGCSG